MRGNQPRQPTPGDRLGPTIRLAVESDAQGISALIYSQLHHRAPTPTGSAPPEFLAGFAPETIQGYLGSLRYRYWVALMDGQLVGVLGIRDRQQLLHLFVAELYQRRGIASALWKQARFDLLTGGEVRLLVNSSVYTLPVYERFGFKAIGPRVEGVGVTYVPMQLVINLGGRPCAH